jgi:hypothetical protein
MSLLNTLYDARVFNLIDPDEVDVLLNLLLVSGGGRKAFLVESANWKDDSLRFYKLFLTFLEGYCKMLGVRYRQQKGAQPRILVFSNEITVQEAQAAVEGDDVSMGRVLGFDCPADLGGDKTRWGVNYMFTSSRLNKGKPLSLTAEMCSKDMTATWNAKAAKFQKVLREWYLDATVKTEIKVTHSPADVQAVLKAYAKQPTLVANQKKFNAMRDALIDQFWNASFFHTISLLEKRNALCDKKYAQTWYVLHSFISNHPMSSMFGNLQIEQWKQIDNDLAIWEKDFYKRMADIK